MVVPGAGSRELHTLNPKQQPPLEVGSPRRGAASECRAEFEGPFLGVLVTRALLFREYNGLPIFGNFHISYHFMVGSYGSSNPRSVVVSTYLDDLPAPYSRQ